MIRVLIVGTGGMARNHAEAYAAMDNVTVVAGVDPNAENLKAFQEAFGIPRGFASVQEALDWGGFDAVSNVTPDAIHHRTTLPLLAAGKHVLCEKPLAANQADAAEMAAAAAEAGVVNMVNLSYRNGPALIHAAELVAAGRIGAVRHFEASYLQSWLTQNAWGNWREQDQWLWRLSTAHGSMGVLGDVGVHILDFASYAAGALPDRVSCRLRTFDKAPEGKVGHYTLDANDSAVLHLSLANGAVGVVHTSRFATGHLNDLRLRLYGTEGGIDVRFEKGESTLTLCADGDIETATWRPVAVPPVPTIYERFITGIRDGTKADPDFAHGAALQRVLDLAVRSDAEGGCDQVI